MNVLQRLIPFITFGIILVILIAGIVLLSYLLILGAAVGLVLFVIAWFKEKLFPRKDLMKRPRDERQGRIINHDDK